MRLGDGITNKVAIRSFEGLAKKLWDRHKDRFDYSKVVYLGMESVVEIICPKHGLFLQTPQQHLRSNYGCPHCSLENKVVHNKRTQESFIEDVDKVQNGNYDLSNIKFITTDTRYEFICKIHNITFIQKGMDALSGKCGCTLCNSERNSKRQMKSQEQWLEEATLFHKGKFDYSLVDYTGNKNRVKIICPTHGVFEQIAQQHLQHGCDKCARDLSAIERYKDTPTKFYSFKYNGLYKIGVTTRETVKQRYKREQIVWDDVSELIEVQFDGFVDAYMLEQFLLNEYVKYKYQGNTIFKYTKNTEVFTEDIYQMYLQEADNE